MTDYLELALEELEEQETEDGALGTERGAPSVRAPRKWRKDGREAVDEDPAEVGPRRGGAPLGAGEFAAALGAPPEDWTVDGTAAEDALWHGGGTAAAGLPNDGGWPYGADPRSAGEIAHDDGVRDVMPGRALVRSAVARKTGEARLEALPPPVWAGGRWQGRETRRGVEDAAYGGAGRPGTEGAPAVYERLRRGARSLDWVQRRPGQAAQPVAEQVKVQRDPATLDLIFQRDARRYGGAFTLY